jgi:hypothetical protein
MISTLAPNRWMRLRRAVPFPQEEFDCFCAHALAFAAYASTWLQNWSRIPAHSKHPSVEYAFFPPEVSQDRLVVSLPIGGASTLSTRAALENGSSYMLWQFLPTKSMEGLEEGLTETIDPAKGPVTSWRLPSETIGFANASPEFRQRVAR